MARNSLKTELHELLNKYAGLFVAELENKGLKAAKRRLEQMVALIESVGDRV